MDYRGAPTAVALADVNGDGSPDIVVGARPRAGQDAALAPVLVVPGDGRGGLGVPLALGRGGSSALALDLNHDGRADIVSGKFVYLATAGAGFLTPDSLSCEAKGAADLNGDGHPDLIGLSSDSLVVFVGRGDGSFEPGREFLTVGDPRNLAIADLNGDGKLDVAVSPGRGALLAVHLGTGPGLFAEERAFPTQASPNAAEMSDVNGDGVPDLLTVNGSDTVSVLMGDGSGGFGAPGFVSVGVGARALLLDDFNNDGRPDLVTANYTAGSVTVRLSRVAGGFEPSRAFRTGAGPLAIVSGDFNEDGRRDIVTLGTGGLGSYLGVGSFLPGDGSGGLGLPVEFQPYSMGYSTDWVAHHAAVADFDGDGHLDLAAISDGDLAVLRGDGHGSFAPSVAVSGGLISGEFPKRVLAVGDMNDDGTPDIVYGARDSTSHVYTRLAVELAVPQTWQFEYPAAAYSNTDDPKEGGFIATELRVADVNGDGILDAIATGLYSNTVTAMLGKGDGSFGQRFDYGAGRGPVAVAVADMNRDGAPDLVVTDSLGSCATVLLNTSTVPALAFATKPAVQARLVELSWVANRNAGATIDVERREVSTAWRTVTAVQPDASGRINFVDHSVEGGHSYGYRLVFHNNGADSPAGEVWVEVPGAALAIHGPWPNPVTGTSRVRISLPGNGPASLEILDVTGRRVATSGLDVLGAGTHTVGLEMAARLPAGLYFLRLRAENQYLQTRLAVVR